MSSDDLLVVEADHGDVLRNRQAELSQSVVESHRHPVVVAEDGAHTQGPNLLGHAVPALLLRLSSKHQRRVVLDPRVVKGLSITLQSA